MTHTTFISSYSQEYYNENVGQTVSCINTPQRADLERLSLISTPLFFLLQWKIQCIFSLWLYYRILIRIIYMSQPDLSMTTKMTILIFPCFLYTPDYSMEASDALSLPRI